MTDSPNPFTPGAEVALCGANDFERVTVRSVFKNGNFTLVDRGTQQYHPFATSWRGAEGRQTEWKAWQTGERHRGLHICEITPELIERYAKRQRLARFKDAAYAIDRHARLFFEPSEELTAQLESIAETLKSMTRKP